MGSNYSQQHRERTDSVQTCCTTHTRRFAHIRGNPPPQRLYQAAVTRNRVSTRAAQPTMGGQPQPTAEEAYGFGADLLHYSYREVRIHPRQSASSEAVPGSSHAKSCQHMRCSTAYHEWVTTANSTESVRIRADLLYYSYPEVRIHPRQSASSEAAPGSSARGTCLGRCTTERSSIADGTTTTGQDALGSARL